MQKEEIYFTTDKYSNLTDEQIITDIKNGDEQALVYLLNKYNRCRKRRYCTRRNDRSI